MVTRALAVRRSWSATCEVYEHVSISARRLFQATCQLVSMSARSWIAEGSFSEGSFYGEASHGGK